MRVYNVSARSYFVYIECSDKVLRRWDGNEVLKGSALVPTKRMSEKLSWNFEVMKRHAEYGVDGPGVVRAFIVSGAVLALIASIGVAWPEPSPVPVSLAIGAAFLAALFLFLAAVMLRASLSSKKRVRDRLVAALALSGNERVLDAGCGRGLALIGCAKKLTTGKAVGIDWWSARDLSSNDPQATLTNAAAEGVADRVEVETGDIRRLPFSDASFDAVISMTVIHNIASSDGRDQALRELIRVLKPGGRIAIFDIWFTSHYKEVFQQAGMKVRDLGYDVLWLTRCRSLLAQKAGNP
jgi:arsenite methyltransferase